MQVAVSFLGIPNLAEGIKKIDNSTADYIHVDIMDGIFVPNQNYQPADLPPILNDTTKPLDVHLMCQEPSQYYPVLTKLHTETITIHSEIPTVSKEIATIKSLGKKVGVAINPSTSVTSIIPLLNQVDLVLVMSVIPGKGGQSFIEDTVKKLAELSSLKEFYHFRIAVDGGINANTIQLVKPYVDLVISGSFIYQKDDYNTQINILKH